MEQQQQQQEFEKLDDYEQFSQPQAAAAKEEVELTKIFHEKSEKDEFHKEKDHTKDYYYDGSDEELNSKLQLLEGNQYDEWLLQPATACTAAEDTTTEKGNGSNDTSFSFDGVNDDYDEDEGKKIEKGNLPYKHLEEPYSSCLQEVELEEMKKRKEMLERQKREKRESSKSIQYTFPITKKKSTHEVDPWKYSPGAEIEHRQRNLAALDRKLEFETSQLKSLKQSFDKRWDKTAASLKTISDALGKLDDLEEDCREKRKQHNEITKTSKNETAATNHQIKIYKKELEFLSRLLIQCQQRLEKHKIFEDFIRLVKDASHGEFKTVRQVNDRFLVLRNIRDRLTNWQWENERDIFRANEELYSTTKRRTKNYTLQDNYLSDLRKYHESNLNKLAVLEDQLILVKTAAASQCMLVGQLDLCVHNLYLEICKQIRVTPKAHYTKTKDRTKITALTQLGDIEACMKELDVLCKDIQGNNLTSKATCNVHMDVDTQALYKQRLKFKI